MIYHYAHTLSPRSWFEQIWIWTIWGCFNTSFGFSDRFVSEKNFSNCLYVKICHPIAIVAPFYTLWLWFKQTWTILSASTQVSAFLDDHYIWEDVSKCFFSLKEGLTLHFNMLEFPLQNYSLCQVLLKFGIREKVEIVKIKIKMYTVYRQTNRRTEAGQKVIRKVYLSFQLRWTKIKTPY